MDCRDYAVMTGRWYDSFDQKNMLVSVELYDDDTDEEYMAEFPATFEVCGLCGGKGSHVNPSIDAHGISAEEFNEDPYFAEAYFNGVYDVVCYECKGLRVTPTIDTHNLTDQQKKDYDVLQEKIRDNAMYAAERAAERRMGC